MLTKSEPLRCVAHSRWPVTRFSATTDPLMPMNTKSEVFIIYPASLRLLADVQFADLRIEGPEIVDQNSADEQQTSREEPDRAGNWLAVIKPVGAGKAKNPDYVADHRTVGLHWRVHNLAR